MKTVVALIVVFASALAAPNDYHIPVINNLGVPLEPAENVAARAAHAAAHSQVLAGQGQFVQPAYDPSAQTVPFHSVQTPVNIPNFAHNGQPIETPEVAAAKAAHFAAHTQVNSVIPYQGVQQNIAAPVPYSIPQGSYHQNSNYDDGSYYEGKYDTRPAPVVPFQQNIAYSSPVFSGNVEDDGSYYPGKYDPIVQPAYSGQYIPTIPSRSVQPGSSFDDGSYYEGKYETGVYNPINAGQYVPVVNQVGGQYVQSPVPAFPQTFGNVPQDTPEVAAAKAAHFAALSGNFGYSTVYNPQPAYQGVQAGVNQGLPVDTPEVAAAKAAHFAAHSLAAH